MSSLAEEFRIISGPALFFLTGWLFTDAQDVKRLGKAVIGSAIWIYIGILVAYAIGKEHFSFAHFGANPLEGMYYHKHDLARVSTMICVFSLCFTKMTESRAMKYFCYAVAASMVVIVFASYTRMSWIAIFLCICFWFIWVGKWKQVLVIAPLVVALSWDTLDASFRRAHFNLANPNLTDPKSISGRGAIWKAQVKGFLDMNPAEQLLGGGYNRSVGLSVEYGEDQAAARNAHSCIPLMLVENGILFTAIYNILLLRLCRDAWALRKGGDVRLQLLGALFLVGVAYFYLSGITTNSHTYPSLTWYVWGLGGIVYRIRHFPVEASQQQSETDKTHRFFSRSFAPAPLVRPPS
jgi:O-antigen ligase